MAYINRFELDGKSYARLVDGQYGRRIQYTVDINSRYPEKLWLKAHSAVMQSISPEDKEAISNKRLKELVIDWANTPQSQWKEAKVRGIKSEYLKIETEKPIQEMLELYIKDFLTNPDNGEAAKRHAVWEVKQLSAFFNEKQVPYYSKLQRETLMEYPAWRNSHRQDDRDTRISAWTCNHELQRFKAVVRFACRYHDWRERYINEGIRVKATSENTKTVRPLDINEQKTVLKWLYDYSEKRNDWYIHDIILLTLLSGAECKVLQNLKPSHVRSEIGIWELYGGQLISGVLDAKNQHRNRSIPISKTIAEIFRRGFVFQIPSKTLSVWIERKLKKCESETGIPCHCHLFRHCFATNMLSKGEHLSKIAKLLGHAGVTVTVKFYARYDLSASTEGFKGMIKAYAEHVNWLNNEYFSTAKK